MKVSELLSYLRRSQRMSATLESHLMRLVEENPAINLERVLMVLDDDAQLTEILRAFNVMDAPTVSKARDVYLRRCDALYKEYKLTVELSYQPLLTAPDGLDALMRLAIRRQDIELLRGEYAVLRPHALNGIRQQQEAMKTWLARVGAEYQDYASTCAEVIEHVA